MDLLVAINGTGTGNEVAYNREFAKSHVIKIHEGWDDASNSFYQRGPTLLGRETADLARNGINWLHRKMGGFSTASSHRIFLTGYSRGGAAVVSIAQALLAEKVAVEAMFLFDAVNRSTVRNVDTVPANVKSCFHARRSPKAGSRESFGNCATAVADRVNFVPKFFFATHGGMGGCPFPTNGRSGRIEELSAAERMGVILTTTILSGGVGGLPSLLLADKHDLTNVTVEQDERGSKAVWDWMSKRVAKARMGYFDAKMERWAQSIA